MQKTAIVEFSIPEEQTTKVLKLLKEVSKTLNTVASMSIAARVAEDGTWPTEKYVKAAGYSIRPNAKINVGLGKI